MTSHPGPGQQQLIGMIQNATTALQNATTALLQGGHQDSSFPSFLPARPGHPNTDSNLPNLFHGHALRRNYSTAQIEKALEQVHLCNGNVSQAARDLHIPQQTLAGWYAHPPKKLFTRQRFKAGPSGPKPILSEYLEAKLAELIHLGNEEGETTCLAWVQSFARDLAEREEFQASEMWFYRVRHRALLQGMPIKGRTPSEIFQNQITKDRAVEIVKEFWETWLAARVRYSLDTPDLILAWDEMNMPLEVHGKWIYVVGTIHQTYNYQTCA